MNEQEQPARDPDRPEAPASQPASPPSGLAIVRRAIHLLSEGVRGLLISPGQVLACVASLAVATCLVTLFGSFGSTAVDMLERAGHRARVIIYLKERVSSEQVSELLKEIGKRPDVEFANYLSAEEDRARNAALLPPDLASSLPPATIPGQHCIEAGFGDSTERIPDVVGLTSFLRDLEEVEVVAEPPVGAARIRAASAAVRFGRLALSVLAALLVVSTLFFVVGTLTRTMERRREEMSILRLIGATDAFLKTPLYIQGILQGAAGVLIGASLGRFAISAANTWLATELAVAISLPTGEDMLVPFSLLAGAVIGTLGAFIATSRRLP
ncbi:MAG: FtsX-like permease family protein [Deltaproteobacteria bacterium]|nr:FtsX-like permease family protein [Deltaproteobacteria bacterium]